MSFAAPRNDPEPNYDNNTTGAQNTSASLDVRLLSGNYGFEANWNDEWQQNAGRYIGRNAPRFHLKRYAQAEKPTTHFGCQGPIC